MLLSHGALIFCIVIILAGVVTESITSVLFGTFTIVLISLHNKLLKLQTRCKVQRNSRHLNFFVNSHRKVVGFATVFLWEPWMG